MSMIDALKEKPEALVKISFSQKHLVYMDEFREHIKNDMAENIGLYLLKEGIIVFDETKDENEITISTRLYVVDIRKLKEGGEK